MHPLPFQMIINDWDCRAPLGITLRRKGKSVTFGICGGTYVLVQRELDKSTSMLRDCLWQGGFFRHNKALNCLSNS